jgi:4'-phosphopantetheinyl transferase
MPRREIHILGAALAEFSRQLPRLQAILSPAERKRAARFHFAKDHDSYVIRHAILRILLGGYLGKPPVEIDFRCCPAGKPELASDAGRQSFHFSHSHSGDFALYAFTAVCPMGVDIECVRPIPDFEKIVAHYFSPREAGMMRALSPQERMEAFYACWTCKEAFLKATGEGIGKGLAQVEVRLAPGEEPKILGVPGQPRARAEWKLRAFSPAPGYLGAVAFKHSHLPLKQWKVPRLAD